jgi:hypothetical protein
MSKSASVVVLLVAACGGPTVPGTLRVVMGPTPDLAARPAGPPVDGPWLLSPRHMTVHVRDLLLSPDGDATAFGELRDCDAHYDLSLPSLTLIASCPIELPPGTYDGYSLKLAGEYEDIFLDDVVLDDAGIYSDPSSPTLLTTAAPAGGAQPIRVRANETDPSGYFDAPITIAEGQPFTIDVAIDALQFLEAEVGGGTAHVGHGDFTSTLLPHFVASATPFDHVGWYTSADVGTAGSLAPTARRASLSVYYSSATAAQHVHSLVFDPGHCIDTSTVDFAPRRGARTPGPGGYVGVDASGTIGWAIPGLLGWDSYTAILALPQRSELGDTTTLSCTPIARDPAPPGDSFSSGVPSSGTPEYTLPMILAAR